MNKYFRIVLLAALIAGGIFAWRALFPSPEKIIRSRLEKLAETASFEPEEGIVPRALKADKLRGFFTPDVELALDVPEYQTFTLSGRDELLERAKGAFATLRGLKVEFPDIVVTVDPGGESATANVTGRAIITGRSDSPVQEFNFQFKKVEDKWLIYRIETVRTLS